MLVTYHRHDADDREGWLALREGKVEGHEELGRMVGGSQIGAICGHNKYSSFLTELEYDTGYSERPNLDDVIAVELGRLNEPVGAMFFERVSGKKVHKVNAIITNTEYPDAKASIDRKIANEDSGLEIKTSFGRMMDSYKPGDFPMCYWDQCLLYLCVTGLLRWYLCILTGREFHVYLMTTVKEEEERFNYLRRKFLLQKDGEGPEWDEWVSKWKWVMAVYYVDGDEMEGVKIRTRRYCEARDMVLDYMKGKTFSSEKERKSFLQNAIVQVVDPEDIEDGDSSKKALAKLYEDETASTTLRMARTSPDAAGLIALSEERVALAQQKREIEKKLVTNASKIIEQVIRLKAGEVIIEAEDGSHSPIKISYTKSDGKRSVSADEVEMYFRAHKYEVPPRLITKSAGTPTLRVNAIRPNVTGAAKRLSA